MQVLQDIVSGVAMIHVRCPKCNVILQVDYKQRGRSVRCPSCRTAFPAESTAFSGAEKPERKKKKPKKKPQEKKLRRSLKPYETIDESELAQIPVHHGFRNFCLVLGGLLVLGAGVFFGRGWIQQRNTAGEFGGLDEQSLPAYAQKMHTCIRAAGYGVQSGAVDKDEQYYHCRLRVPMAIHLYAFPEGTEVVSTGFYACGRFPLQGGFEMEEVRRHLGKVMGEYLAASERPVFSQWVWAELPECARALRESREFAREKQFGDMVVRLHHGKLYDLGTGIAVSMMRAGY